MPALATYHCCGKNRLVIKPERAGKRGIRKMEKLLRMILLKRAERYAKLHGLSMATVSRRFHGTDSFFDDFRNGKVSITLRKWDQVIYLLARAEGDHKNVVKNEPGDFKNRRKIGTGQKTKARRHARANRNIRRKKRISRLAG